MSIPPSRPLHRTLLLLALALATVLSSCLPAVGNRSTDPIDLDALEPGQRMTLKLGAGSTWYLTEAFPAEAFGYTLSDRNDQIPDLLFDSDVGDTRSTYIDDFELVNVTTTEGLEFELVHTTLERAIVDADPRGSRSRTFSFVDRVRVLYRLTIPETAESSRAVVTAFLDGPDDMEVPVLLGLDFPEVVAERR